MTQRSVCRSRAVAFGIQLNTGDAEADALAELLLDHLANEWPLAVPKETRIGETIAVVAAPDAFGWALAALKGRLSETDRLRLSNLADDIDEAVVALPADGRSYFASLSHLARSAVAFRGRQ